MTNQEIKFELAKVALNRCNFLSSETFTESLHILYEWIISDDDKEQDDKPNMDKVNETPINAIIDFVKTYFPRSYATKLDRIFGENSIRTIGELLKIGKRNFKQYRDIGSGSISVIEKALWELYKIQIW